MSEDPVRADLTALERLDVALASRLAVRAASVDVGRPEDLCDVLDPPGPEFTARAVAGLLSLRGVAVRFEDVAAALSAAPSGPGPERQDHRLARGLSNCLELARSRAREGRLPDGWFLLELVRILTADIPRFRNNHLRRDAPWDAVPFLTYPDPGELPMLLETFTPERCYRDFPPLFESLHPVRRAFRVMWRFARIAPFPDMNLILAVVAMNGYLLASGYPAVPVRSGDRALLHRVVGGPPPRRIGRFEARLAAAAEAIGH